jgi:hypothetical protein
MKHATRHLAIVMHSQLLYKLKCESKVKITEEQGLGARSLARNILGVEGCVGAPK